MALTKCTFCGATLVFYQTPNKKAMPVNVEDLRLVDIDSQGQLTLKGPSHFASCPTYKKRTESKQR